MLLLALMGFVPVDPTVSPSPDPLHLDRHGSIQLRMGARSDWRAFRERWGGRWAAVWDERTGNPRFLYAPGVPLARADALVADVAALARVDEAELVPAGVTAHGDRELRRYARTWRGVPVEGDEVGVVAIDDRILAVWVRLTPLGGLTGSPRPGERVLVRPGRGDPAIVTRVDTPSRVTYRDRAGEEIYAYDPRRFATVEVAAEARTVGDALVEGPARHVTVTDAAAAVAETDDAGFHGLSGPVDVWFDGSSLAVTDAGAAVHVAADADALLTADVDVPWAVADVQAHFYVVWDWLRDRWPTHRWLADRVPADVRVDGSCNAYYSSGSIHFFRETAGACNDLGRVSDVVYHETGHGIHDYILTMGTFAGDISEGSADFTSATIWDDPVVGVDAWGPGTYVRELDTDRSYPTDVVGEVHNDGLIWGSFLWNWREIRVAADGYDAGVRSTDLLFLGALEQGPTLTDVYEAVLVADDDDGDWTNGTPHACELRDLLDYHGLGPGPIGVVTFDHEPLGPQSSWTESYPVVFDLYDLTTDCSGLDPATVQLWYTVGDAAAPGTPERGGGGDTADSGGGGDTARAPDTGDTGVDPDAGLADYTDWVQVPLVQDGVRWTGVLPRQLAGTRVRYFMQASSTDGTQTLTTYAGDDTRVYAFWVGDRHTIWCEGFEAGAPDWTHGSGDLGTTDPSPILTDEWVVGTPAGTGDWDPDAAAAGAGILSTVLDGNYTAMNREWARGPVVDATGHGPMLLLTQQRWLTVEDGRYDQAGMWVNGALVWSNLATAAGSTASLDVGWVGQDLAAEALLAPDGTIQVAYTLASDQGLEYGGWALDEVCLVDLDDVPGHYRVRDLTATDTEPTVTVTWTQPWIAPLTETVLVRRLDAAPTGPEDGVVLDRDAAPVPGSAKRVVDPGIGEGETAWYAVFASDGTVYTDAVEGQNVDVGGVPRPVPPDTGDDTAPPIDSTPTGTSGDDSAGDSGGTAGRLERPGKPAGCGCASGGPRGGVAGGAGGGFVVVGILGVWARRRRR